VTVGFPVVETLEQALTEFTGPRRVLIDNLIREVEVAALIGGTKARKSWAMKHVGLCGASGRPWLGCVPTRPLSVLMVDLELHKHTHTERLQTIMRASGIRSSDTEGRLDRLCLRGHVKTLEELLDCLSGLPKKYDLYTVDPLCKLLSGLDESNNADMLKVFNQFDAFTQSKSSSLMFSHHQTKGRQAQKATTDMGSGAGTLSRAVDGLLVMRKPDGPRQSDSVVLERELRSFAPVPPQVIRWDFPLWVVDEGKTPDEVRKDTGGPSADDVLKKRAVYEAVCNGLRSVEAIRKHARLGVPRCSKFLDQLVKEGLVRVGGDEKFDPVAGSGMA